jgi:hypothetical protein
MSLSGASVSSEGSLGKRTISDIRCESCPICLDEMSSKLTVTTVCLHTFCYDCLNRHMSNCRAREVNQNCPYCRTELFARSDAEETRGSALSLSDLVSHDGEWDEEVPFTPPAHSSQLWSRVLPVLDLTQGRGHISGAEDGDIIDLDDMPSLVNIWNDNDDDDMMDADALEALVASRPSIYEMSFSNVISNELFAYDENEISNNNINILSNLDLREDMDMETDEILENLDNQAVEAVEDMNSARGINNRDTTLLHNGREGLGNVSTELLLASLREYRTKVYTYMNNHQRMNNNQTHILSELLKYINTLEQIAQYCRLMRGYAGGTMI